MNVDVTMPQLGETVAEGTVTRWLKRIGEVVADQEPLLEISTDKVDTEVPSPAAGTLLEIRVPEDSTVSVGTVLAVLGSAAAEGVPSAPAAAVSEAPAAPAVSPEVAPGAASPAAGPTVASGRRHEHTPRVRRLAAEAGVPLGSLVGTGPAGRVTPDDVALAARTVDAAPAASAGSRAAGPQGPPAPPAALVEDGDSRVAMTRLRSVVAERMMTSLHTSAQLTTVVEVDVTAVAALRRRVAGPLRERLGVRLTLTAFFAKAAVEALQQHRLLNASVDADGRTVVHHARTHLGVAVDTDRGLMVPVVKDAGELSLLGLARRIPELAERVRSGAATIDDLSGGTFTLTNTGSRGALWDTPILVPGQVGILGTGAVVERPVVMRDADDTPVIGIRSMAYLALTYDHRLVDGADAARFLTTVKDRLEAGRFDDELG